MLKYHEKPWPHFTGILPEDFYNIVKDKWDTDDNKKEWNKCKNRSNIVIEDDKIKLFCDAQTSGGLLISLPGNSAINPKEVKETYGIDIWEIGEINTKYNEKINII